MRIDLACHGEVVRAGGRISPARGRAGMMMTNELTVSRRLRGLAAGLVSPAAILLAVLLTTAPAAADTHRLVMLDGTTVTGKLERIAEGEVVLSDDEQKFEVDQLRGIARLADGPRSVRWDHEVRLAREGRLNVSRLEVDEQVRFDWKYGEDVKLPLPRIAAVRLDADQAPASAFAEALEEEAGQDRIAAKQDDRILLLDGAFTSLDDDGASLVYRDQSRRLSRERFYGVVFAPVADGQPEGRNRFLLHLDDGSTLPADRLSVEDGAVEVVFADVELSLPFEQVSRIEVRSERMAFLSDLEPVEVEEDPGLDLPRPWQRDRNARGGPIKLKMPPEEGTSTRLGDRLSARRFDKGLGVRSRSRLVFEIEGGYTTFAAIAGIDAMTGGRGEVEMVVKGDGEELWRQKVQGDDAGREVQVDITDVERLELLVEFGDELSLSGIANWADARVLR